MNDNPFNFEGDPDSNDPLHREEAAIRAQIKNLVDKINGTSNEPVVNEDLLQYMRIINFNFAAMSKMVSTFIFRMNVVETTIEALHKKLDNFLESISLIEESLNEPSASDESKPV